MSKSSEMALKVYQEQFEQNEQARDMQEILDQQAHQEQLKLQEDQSEFDIDKINKAIRRLNELNKGIL
tara:strand:+ start:1831 stop:2034 length:204 start_codon:yes stop_codon:yes gene_type:complete